MEKSGSKERRVKLGRMEPSKPLFICQIEIVLFVGVSRARWANKETMEACV